MTKQSKRSLKRNNSLKSKKKKPIKKMGLAKFIKSDVKPKKIKDLEEVDADMVNLEKNNAEIVKNLKNDKKNLNLIDRCKLQMSSSLLRLMDEDLYTSDTKDVALNKEKFLAYHEAYESVCKKWPTKPIDYIVKFIKKRILVKEHSRMNKFADIGCGPRPILKMKLPPSCKVLSFDLVSAHEDIIEANMEKLPIDDANLHCVVYSLSLMAKNLGNIILEGKRVLRVGGSMLVVEVTSRFEGNEKKFIGKLDKLGLKKKSMTVLKPNGYFTFFHFTKIDSELDYSPSCLNIQLKPCIYKSR